MSAGDAKSVTMLLRAVEQGEGGAEDRLLDRVYEELRRMARAQLRGDGVGRIMDPTSLVNEAYIRLAKNGECPRWDNRRHFFGAVSRAMWRVRVEKARQRRRREETAAGSLDHVPQDAVGPVQPREDPDWVLALDTALRELERLNPLAFDVFHLRHFVGMTVKETACALEVSDRTVEKEHASAKAILRSRMRRAGFDGT